MTNITIYQKFMIILRICFIALISYIVPASAKNTSSDTRSINTDTKCTLVFGVDGARPFQFVDSQNNVVGMQVDLVKAIVNELNCEIKFEADNWNSLIEKLKAGEVDFIPDVTPTEERSKYGVYSAPYRKEVFILYVRREDYQKYSNKEFSKIIEQGFRLGLISGYVYDDSLKQLSEQEKYAKNFFYNEDNQANYQLLLEYKVDGFLEDSVVAGYNLRILKINHKVSSLPLSFEQSKVRFMFDKKRFTPQFIEKFNNALLKVKQSKKFRDHLLFYE